MNKILIATTNIGKFKEIIKEFSDLDIEFLNLKDVKLDHIDLDEPYDTTEENAIHKARFFAKKTKLPTIAEDTGFYVKVLKGKPGVKAKRFASTPEKRIARVLDELKGVKKEKRGAYFKGHLCIYFPKTNNYSIFEGKVNGEILNKVKGKYSKGLQYDSIFYYPPYKKTFAEMSISEKNLISHRGKILTQLKYFLMKQMSFKQYLVVGGIVVKNRKMLLQKRRDIRPEFNNKWEFVGGGIDNGESVLKALQREVKEECGYLVEPVEQLPEIINKVEKKFQYQVFLLLYICKIKSGKLNSSDTEAAGHGWFTIDEALRLDFLPANINVIKRNKKVLKKYID